MKLEQAPIELRVTCWKFYDLCHERGIKPALKKVDKGLLWDGGNIIRRAVFYDCFLTKPQSMEAIERLMREEFGVDIIIRRTGLGEKNVIIEIPSSWLFDHRDLSFDYGG